MDEFVDYAGIMDRLFSEARTIFAGRVLSRKWIDFTQCSEPDLEVGVVCIVSDGISDYPYDNDLESFGRHQILVTVQGSLPDAAGDGAAIERAEFAAIRQIERLSRRAGEVEMLAGVRLLRCTQSKQLQAPYWWVAAQFENYAEATDG